MIYSAFPREIAEENNATLKTNIYALYSFLDITFIFSSLAIGWFNTQRRNFFILSNPENVKKFGKHRIIPHELYWLFHSLQTSPALCCTFWSQSELFDPSRKFTLDSQIDDSYYLLMCDSYRLKIKKSQTSFYLELYVLFSIMLTYFFLCCTQISSLRCYYLLHFRAKNALTPATTEFCFK